MQLLTSQKIFKVLSICIPKRINGIISEVQLWKKISFLVSTSGKFLEALGTGIGTGSIFCLSFSLSNRVRRDFEEGRKVVLQTQIFCFCLKTTFIQPEKSRFILYTVAEYSWSIANNFVIGFYCRCLEILCQITFSSIANYFRSYRKKQFGIESVGIYSRNL